MVMPDGEIITMYRQAADQLAQVRILAELNNVSESVMREALCDLGLDVPPARKRRGGFAQRIDFDAALRFYEAGASDREIAAQVGATPTTIQQWRNRNHLPPN